jgi:hypothetical protein
MSPLTILAATDWEKWTAIGTLTAAAATLILAGVTLALVFATRGSVAKAAEEIAITRERLDASQRPHVFPAPNLEWIAGSERYAGRWNEVLPVRNGGPGVALNVFGQLQWPSPSGVFVMLIATSLAPNTAQDMALDWSSPRDDWDNVSGFLEYEDVTGSRWRTGFHIQSRRHIRVLETTPVAEGDETPGFMTQKV